MKISKIRHQLPLWCGILLLANWTSLSADTQTRARVQQRVSAAPTPADIVQFVRDRFEYPPTVKVDAQPVHQAPFSHFYQTAVTVDDGKQKGISNVFITTDARCFVYGNIFALTGVSDAEVVHCLREAAKLPATAEITVGAFASSAFPDFLKATVTVRQGTKVQSGDLFVTRDRRTGILGLVLPFRRDFVEQLINTKDQPSVGPVNARVTIVEYADLDARAALAFRNSWRLSSCRATAARSGSSLKNSLSLRMSGPLLRPSPTSVHICRTLPSSSTTER